MYGRGEDLWTVVPDFRPLCLGGRMASQCEEIGGKVILVRLY